MSGGEIPTLESERLVLRALREDDFVAWRPPTPSSSRSTTGRCERAVEHRDGEAALWRHRSLDELDAD